MRVVEDFAALRQPYPGLRSFEPDEDLKFFGRETNTAELLRRLSENRFVAVVGSSGSGKSSLVRAGLLPALHRGRLVGATSRWRTCLLTPGEEPMKRLAEALAAQKVFSGDPQKVLDQIQGSSLGLANAVRSGGLTPGESLLLVIDQFEELFRFVSERREEDGGAEARLFVSSLLEAADLSSAPVYVVSTMRSDFIGDCSQFPGLSEALNRSLYLIPLMKREQIRDAIERPPRLVGAHINGKLVERLLNEVGNDPGSLPVLQHALARTFQEYERRGSPGEIGEADYAAAGGLEDALNSHATAVLRRLCEPDPEMVRWTEKVFRCLTTVENGRKVRRPARLDRIYSVAGACDDVSRSKVRKVVEAYSDRDQTMLDWSGPELAGESVVDISHESLISHWRLLDGWVTSEAEAANLYRSAVEDAIRSRRGAASRWRSLKLSEALAYLHEGIWNGAWAERVIAEQPFDEVKAFLEAEGAAQLVEDTRLERQLEAERKAKEDAEHHARVATAQRLLVEYSITPHSNRRLLLALASVQGTVRGGEPPLRAAQAALRESLAEVRGRSLGIGHRAAASDIVITADCRWIVTCGADRTIRLWDMQAPDPALGGFVLYTDPTLVHKLALSGDRIVGACADRTVRLWNMGEARSGEPPVVLGPLEWPIRCLALSPNGRWLAVGTEWKAVYLWDVENLQQWPEALEGHNWGIRTLAFGPDSNWLSSGSDDHTARLWRMDAPHAESRVLVSENSISAVCFTPDGASVIIGGVDKKVSLWDLRDPSVPPVVLGRFENSVVALATSPDGRWLAAAIADEQTVRVWDLTEPHRPPEELRRHEDWLSVLAFSPDSRWLVTASADKTARVWSLGSLSTSPIVLSGHDRCVRSAAISPDSRWLATCGDDGAVQYLDLNNPGPVYPRVFEGARSPAAISNDGNWLVTVAPGEKCALWSLAGDVRQVTALGSGGPRVRDLRISPDSHWLAAATASSEVRLWDLRNPAACFALHGHSWNVRCLAFTPDSKRLLSGGDDFNIFIWDTAAISSPPVCIKGYAAVYAIAVSPDGAWMAAGDWSGYVSLWNIINGQFVFRHSRRVAQHRIWLLEFSPDSRWLFAGGHSENVARLFDLLDPEQPCIEILGHSQWLTAAVFTAGSRLLITGSEDSQIALRNLDSPVVPFEHLRGHEWGIRGLSLRSDGAFLASCSDDKTVRIWNLLNRSEVPIVLRGHQAPVTTVQFTPGGDWLLSASPYDSARMWDLCVGRLSRLACDILKGNFTQAEWERYFSDEDDYWQVCPDAPVPFDVIEEELRRVKRLTAPSDRDLARSSYERLVQWAGRVNDSRLIAEIGRQGCLAGFAATVLPACERAASLEPDNPDYRSLIEMARTLAAGSSAGVQPQPAMA
jgi:WD40 repeat protein